MSQPSQLVSLEAKAAPFIQLRTESPTSPEGALPMQVIRRNGTVSKFDASKISVAMTKAFLAVEGHTAAASRRVHEVVEQLTAEVVGALSRRISEGRTFHIEDVQDQVELALMRSEHHKVARAYVLYREERTRQRAEQEAAKSARPSSGPMLHVTLANGTKAPLDTARLVSIVNEACAGLEGVEAAPVLAETQRNLYDGISEDELALASVMAARTLVELEPNYAYVSARLLLDKLRTEVLSFVLDTPTRASQADMAVRYAEYFPAYVKTGIKAELLDPDLARFDLKKLAAALKPERDLAFQFLGLQTLYDRYFLHEGGNRIELPQAFFMRVAMGLALREIDREARAIEFYDLLSSFDFMASTPTLFNSGTLRPQLSSCFLTTIADDLDGIFKSVKDNALLAKYSGGLGNDWTRVRGLGAHIKGTNGESQGVVPFLKVANDTAIAVNQGGKRKGAVCAYLETWHIDIEEFLDLRKNTGDDRRRTHDMNTANWVPDLFMQRVEADGEWTLFSPDETPDLHDLYGQPFAERYAAYEAKAARGEIRVFKQVRATDLWRKMLTMLFETGHPWITFKDPCNLRSPQRHAGVIHSSNLCTEITLNTSDDETAVCNLGSINLLNHIHDGRLNDARLKRTVTIAMRMLDNVIDINFYTIPEARRSNLRHRPVGLGLMGFQDALQAMRIAMASDAAVAFADTSMEAISYYAISASVDLAAERGRYPSFDGSLWSQGILPIDSIELLADARGGVAMDRSTTLDWVTPARARQIRRHAQLERDGDRADGDDLQHLRRRAVDRARLPESLRQIQHVRRLHRRERVPGARPQGARAVGRGDGQRPQIFRRQSRFDRPHSRRSQGDLCHRLRDRQRLADRGGLAAAEMDRPVAVAQSLYRQPLRQEARFALSPGMGARSQDHLLPALAQRHACREVHAAGHRRQAQQCRVRDDDVASPHHRRAGCHRAGSVRRGGLLDR